MTPQFIDLSQFQPEDINWQEYKNWSAQGDGISRVAMRSSYGYGFEDPHFGVYRASALAAGIDQIIFYHYAYPQYNSAIVEANWQCHIMGNIRPQNIPALDFHKNICQARTQ